MKEIDYFEYDMDQKEDVQLADSFKLDIGDNKGPADLNKDKLVSSDEKLSEAAQHYLSEKFKNNYISNSSNTLQKKRGDSLPLYDREPKVVAEDEEFNLFAPAQMKVRSSNGSNTLNRVPNHNYGPRDHFNY